jgi:flavin-binding protein dodecin
LAIREWNSHIGWRQPFWLPAVQGGGNGCSGVSKITAASPASFDVAVHEGLARANRTLRGITGLHVIEQKASVRNGKIDEFRVTWR